MNLIRSTKHEIHIIPVNKIALSGTVDQRHILEEEDILRGLSDVVNWRYVFQYSPLSEAFIEEYATEEDWPILSHFQKLSEPFMDKHEEDLEWSILCRFQKMSETFMEKHLNLLDWVAVCIYIIIIKL
ncbi:hypothetical protein TNCV_2914791 [Trichonephila clavipes]|nr:hypothetical protein TNCV_2914791 [Trichonephila clavipes]